MSIEVRLGALMGSQMWLSACGGKILKMWWDNLESCTLLAGVTHLTVVSYLIFTGFRSKCMDNTTNITIFNIIFFA